MIRLTYRPVVSLEPLEHRRLLASTDLDTAFGTGGRALLDHFNESTDYVDAVALTPSGKLLIGGQSDVIADAKATLARYNLDGTPDAGFGAGGKLRLTSGAGFADLVVNANETITTLSSSNAGVAYMRRFTATGGNDATFNFTVTGLTGTPNDLDVTSDGKFYLVVGNHIARVGANGAADGAFGTSGRVTIAQEANFVQFAPQRVAAMPDGSVVVAGRYGSASTGERRIALRRFTATGALDTTFGTGGTFTIPGFSTDTWTDKLTLLPDGKLLIVFRNNFSGNAQSYVGKINPTGSLDTTWNGDGITSLTGPSATFTEVIGDLVLDATGRMYGIGFVQGTDVSNATSFVFRLLATGNLDTTFASGGYNQTFFPAGQLNWGEPRVLLAPNGSLYHVTSNNPFGAPGVSHDQLIFKFDAASGAQDTTFGGGAGRVAIAFNASLSQTTLGSDLLPDGGVAFAGYPPAVSGAQMIVGRLTPAGQPANFGPLGTGTTQISFGTTESLAYDVVGQPDGKIVVAGRAGTFNGSTFVQDYAIARLNDNGTLDTSFDGDGKVVLGYPNADFEQITRVALAHDGKILGLGVHQIVGAAGERRAALLRFNTNGSLDNTFGAGGRLLLNNNDFFGHMIPLADGSVLLGGQRESATSAPPYDDALIVRITPGGAVDATFAGGAGEIRFDGGNEHNSVNGMAVDATGRIYLASWDDSSSNTFNGNLQLRRFTAAGLPDTAFGTANGAITHAWPANTNPPQQLKLTAAGKLLLYGQTSSSPRDLYLMSFLPSGDVDLAFGTNGRQQIDIQGSDNANKLFIGADGHWTLTGAATGATTLGDFAAVRLMGTDQPPDTAPPVVTLGAFRNATAHVVELNFSENVIGLEAGDLTLTRLNGNANVAVPAEWLSYNSEAQRLRITPDVPLPDGNYRLTIAAGAMSDANGNATTTPYALEFFVLAGDANNDRRVNATDQSILNSNFGQSGRTFQQGDFDYNGTVNEADRAILDANFNVWLPAQGATIALPVDTFAATYRLRRESTLYLAAWDNTAGSGAPKHRIRTDAVGNVTLTSFGPDVLVADFSNGPLLDTGRVEFNGSGGSDTLSIIGSTGADVITMDATDITVGGMIVRRTSVETITLDGAGGWDAMTLAGAAAVTFPTPQHLESLTIATGLTATLAAGGANTLVTRALSVAGRLDLTDNDVVIDYSSVSPVGVWTGTAYDGVAGLVKSAKLFSSLGSGTLKTLGVAEAREALQITAAQTANFSGQTVDATAVLVKFTWGGDADLNGQLNIDDYGQIDSHVAKSGSVYGWFVGDFNLDGKINIDDYGIIDGNIGQQDAIL